ncbi:12451_t:CDS:2, partial [Racocetra fulgida]
DNTHEPASTQVSANPFRDKDALSNIFEPDNQKDPYEQGYTWQPLDSDNEALQSWKALEQSLLDIRSLLLDSLSYTNEIRRNEAINCLLPSHQSASEQKEVFGPTEIKETLEKEN